VFVSAATMLNATVFVIATFLWMVNRQFHLSKKKHSYDKEPLRPLKPLKTAKKSSIRVLKKAKRGLINQVRKKRGVTIIVEDASERDEGEVEFEKVLEEEKPKYRSHSTFLEDVEEDEDAEPIAIEQPAKQPSDSSKTKGARELLRLASNIEVFSYLSQEAADEILKYVEYVDLTSEELGKVIFDNNTLDGSLYAVISGEATVNLSVCNSRSKNDNHSFDFVAGEGEVLTSLLTLISSLIREYQLQEAFISSPIPGLIGSEFISVDVNGKPVIDSNKSSLIPDGFDVKAVVSAPNTCLMRIPSRCFVNILDRHPNDVKNICQTIVARLQRVTIQSLVRYLGLEDDIFGIRGHDKADFLPSCMDTIPERKSRKTPEWIKFEDSLSSDSSVNVSLLDRSIPAAGSLLGLPPEKSDLLKTGASIVSFPPGSCIYKPGDTVSSIYLVIKGRLEVGYGKKTSKQSTIKRKESTSPRKKVNDFGGRSLFTAGCGTFVGLFSTFTGDSSFIDVHNASKDNALLLKIPAHTFESIVSSCPRALIHSLLDILDTVGSSPALLLLDWTLDWMHIDAGEHIAVKGQSVDSMFVVLNGRLRSTSNTKSNDADVEYGRGETIGGLEALSEERWTNDIIAMRHCEVARVPMSLLNVLMSLYPSAGLHFARVVARMQSKKGQGVNINKSLNENESLLPSYGLSLATIAVVPLTSDIDVSEFCSSLVASLELIAPTKLLTKNQTTQRIGKSLLSRPSALLTVKMTRFLGDIEENNRVVVYQGERRHTWWTKLAVQQADCVLVVVDSKTPPDLSLVEAQLSWAHSVKNIRIELVVVQSQASIKSGEHASQEVNDWNENRPWVTKQHLIRSPFRDHLQDFNRTVRRITGQSIGLVLGGGGARGLAHLGVIKALNEAGIAVDLVGGTSQGAFIGALYSRNPDDFEQLEKTARHMADTMSSMKEKLLDLTFPITSFFNGSRFNRSISQYLGDIRIQDLVLSYFCVSVDIKNSCQVIHRKGCCWKAVRASMSLAGYLPPMSLGDGTLLVDGGYMNVLPADVMIKFGAKKVIAVDVSYENVPECKLFCCLF